jgi:hypothetical protein
MSDLFVQVVTRTTNVDTTTSSVTVTSVVAGNTLVAFAFVGNTSAPVLHSVADGQATYTAQGSALADGTNNVWGQAYVLENANAGSHVVTFTTSAGNSCWIGVVEVGSTGTGSTSGQNSAFQSGPAAGANTLTSGNATVTAAATLVGMSVDTSSAATSDEPTAGTSPIAFTSRQNNAVSVEGAYRIETAAASTNAAATAGPVTNAHNFMTFVVAILNTTSSAGNIAWVTA